MSCKDAQSHSVPLVKPKHYTLSIPHELTQLKNQRNNLKRTSKRYPSLVEILRPEINRLSKQIHEGIRKIENDNWNQKLSTIEHTDSLWKTSKFLKNRHRNIPTLEVDNVKLITPVEKSEALAHQFEKNHLNTLENVNKSHTTYVNTTVNRFITRVTTHSSPPQYTTQNEVQQLARVLKPSKAPGFDKIHNNLIKKLPPIGFIYLAFIFNCCLKLSYFPNEWKHAKIIGIQKPNKPPMNPSSYRPISLLSSISKLLERIILVRLRIHLDDNNILPPEQHGFRQQCSTITQLNRLTTTINNGLKSRLSESTGMVALDVEKAFDAVWHNGLIYKLMKTNTPKYITKLIHNFLSNRTFQVTVKNGLSSTKNIKYGVPQGSCLSPTLYSLYTYDIPASQNCEVALFADDTAFTVTSRFSRHIVKYLELMLRKFAKYCNQWKIKLNHDKTKALFFTHRRTRQLPSRPIKICGHDVPWETDSLKYLGLHLDNKLKFNHHIDSVIKKGNTAVKILYSLLNRRSHLNIKNKILLYKVGIRPIITYGCPIYFGMAESHRKRLQTFQNKVLKMILDVPWYTRTSDIHNITNVEPIEDFILKCHSNFQQKMENFHNDN